MQIYMQKNINKKKCKSVRKESKYIHIYIHIDTHTYRYIIYMYIYINYKVISNENGKPNRGKYMKATNIQKGI